MHFFFASPKIKIIAIDEIAINFFNGTTDALRRSYAYTRHKATQAPETAFLETAGLPNVDKSIGNGSPVEKYVGAMVRNVIRVHTVVENESF